MNILMMLSVILLSMLMILLSQASDMWNQLELASELKSDLRDIVDWGKKWLVDFNAERIQLVLFDKSVQLLWLHRQNRNSQNIYFDKISF